jgi:hypothetical protein
VNTPQSARHQNVSLSFNASGNGIAIWETGKELGVKLVYSLYDASGGTWSNEAVLASVAEAYTLTSFNYSVASNASGFAVTWEAHAGTNDDHLYAKVYSNGAWSAIMRIDNVDTTYVNSHKLAAASDGYLVVWDQNQNIYSSAYANGAWSAPSQSPAPFNSRTLGLASNGSGYLLAYCTFVYTSCTSAVSSVAYTGAWGQPVVVDASTTGTAQVEIASNGSNYMMIMDDSGLYSSLYSSSSWSVPALLASTAYQSHLKSNGSGYAVAYSTASFWSSGAIYTNLFDGATWGGPQLVESVNSTMSNLVLASSGTDYGVSWRSTSSGIKDLRAAVISSGIPQAAVAVEGSVQQVTHATVAGTGSGFALAWVQYDGVATEKVYTSVLTNTGLSAQSSLLQMAHDSPASSAVFAINASGQRVAVWTQEYFDPGYNPLYPSSLYTTGLFASVYNAGAWGTAQLLRKYGVDPIIVSDGQSFLVAYHSVSSPGGDLYANVYKNSAWGTEKYLGGSVYDKYVATSNNGYAVVWEQYSPATDRGTYAHIYDETAGWDASLVRLDNTTGSAYLSRPASNGSGYAVAWRESDSSLPLYNYASIYDSSTKVWTRTLMVEGQTSGPTVASNGTGYAVAWNDITAGQVLARIFDSGVWQTAARLDNGTAAYPRLVSNGTGYAAAWGSYPTLYANVFNGSSWSGEQVIGQTNFSVGLQLAANDQGYLAYWRVDDFDGTFLYGMIHNGTQWQTSTTLLGQEVTPVEVVGNGTGYAMVWRDDHLGLDHANLGYRIFDGAAWQPSALLENSNISLPFFLYVDVAKDGAGYAAVWVQAHDGYDDPAVNKVWHTTFGQ